MPVLAVPGYRRLWAARTVSQWGDIAQFTALALPVFHLTGSGLGASGVVVAESIPVLLLAPRAGLRADEAPRPVTVAPLWAQAREAVGQLARDRLLRALAVAQTLAALSAGATSALLVILAARRLHTSGGGYGLLLAAIAVGAFTG